MNHFRPASEHCCDRQGHQRSQFGLLRDKSVLVLLVLQGAGEQGGLDQSPSLALGIVPWAGLVSSHAQGHRMPS